MNCRSHTIFNLLYKICMNDNEIFTVMSFTILSSQFSLFSGGCFFLFCFFCKKMIIKSLSCPVFFQHKSNKELKAFLFNDFLLLCKVHTPSKDSMMGIFHPDCDMKLSIYRKVIIFLFYTN